MHFNIYRGIMKMVECSRRTLCTQIPQVFSLYLFTELFDKDFSSLSEQITVTCGNSCQNTFALGTGQAPHGNVCPSSESCDISLCFFHVCHWFW